MPPRLELVFLAIGSRRRCSLLLPFIIERLDTTGTVDANLRQVCVVFVGASSSTVVVVVEREGVDGQSQANNSSHPSNPLY